MKLILFITALFSAINIYAQGGFFKHIVQSGETINSIASKYRADAKYLLMLNNFPNNVQLKSGDIVLIRELAPGEVQVLPKENKSYVEESVYQTNHSGTTAVKQEVARTENMANAKTSATNTAGRVVAPPAEKNVTFNGTNYELSNSGTHVVEKGQTFYRISVIYGISVDQLKEMNGLKNTDIRVGQVLKVPVR